LKCGYVIMKKLATMRVLGIALQAQAEEGTTSFVTYQKTYEQDLAKVEAESRKALEAWSDQYALSLKNLEQKLQKAGDLESLMLVKAEAERFAKARKVSADVLVPAVPELAVLQTRAIQTSSSIELGRCKKVIALVEKYIAGLEELKKSQTKQGRFDDALKTKEEIERAGKRPEVTAAQFALADAAGKAEPAEPAEARKPPAAGSRSLPPAFLKGLVLYCPFDKDEGGKVTDKSGKGNDGKERGAVWESNGITGGAYGFDGKDDYISVADDASLRVTSEFTLSAWVHIDGGQGTHRAILQKLGTSDRNAYLFTANQENQWGISTDGSSGGWSVSGGTVEVGKWHHVVATYDHPTAKLYDNGIEVASSKHCSALPVAGAYEVRIGRASESYYPFNGSIDEVRIYNRALSEQEVKQLFAYYGVAPKSSATSGKASPAKARSH